MSDTKQVNGMPEPTREDFVRARWLAVAMKIVWLLILIYVLAGDLPAGLKLLFALVVILIGLNPKDIRRLF